MKADELSKVLDELALRFGSTGANLWRAYWHATQFYAFTCTLSGVAFGVVCLLASKRIDIDDSDFQWVSGACMVVSAGVIALVVAVNLTDLVMPQGAALHSLMGK
jgi:hypothetical protein